MKNLRAALGALLVIGSAVLSATPLVAQNAQPVDTALIVSVDVSNSVDEARYKLQMEGIAKALEDPGVIDAITGGSSGGILFSMVTWADKPAVVVPWMRIANKADAIAVAQRVRTLPHQGGEFTCMTRMLQIHERQGRSANSGEGGAHRDRRFRRRAGQLQCRRADREGARRACEQRRDDQRPSDFARYAGNPVCCCRRPFPAVRRLSNNGIATT